MKKIIVIISAILIVGTISAQQIPLYSQYMFNKMLINPAVAGSEEGIPVQLAMRQQWVGFENAPSTQVISGQYCFTNYNMGVGAVLFADRFGHERRIGFQANYSYILEVFDDAKLALGLGLQVFQYQLNYDQLVALDEADPNIIGNIQSKIVPEADFGAFLYHDKYFAGISANQMIGMPIKIGDEDIQMSRLVRHYNMMGGYKFMLNPEFELEPSLLLKTSFKAPSQLDLNVRAIYQKNYWLGASYRTAGDVVVLLGLHFNEFDFGIAVDFTTSDIAAYESGSYELMLTYRIPVEISSKGTSKY